MSGEENRIYTERLIFPASPELSKKIDDFRFENRIGSKSEAIRRLIETGLAAVGSAPKAGKVKQER